MTRKFNYECPAGEVTITLEGDGDTEDMIISRLKMMADLQNRTSRRECRCKSVSFYEVVSNDTVEVITYGKSQKMERGEAIAKFREYMAGSEGSERDRYLNVYLDLVSGEKICRDEH